MASTFVTIAASTFAIALTGMARQAYRDWKARRTEIPYSQNWRGEWVADRKLKIFERTLWWGLFAWIALCVLVGGSFFIDLKEPARRPLQPLQSVDSAPATSQPAR